LRSTYFARVFLAVYSYISFAGTANAQSIGMAPASPAVTTPAVTLQPISVTPTPIAQAPAEPNVIPAPTLGVPSVGSPNSGTQPAGAQPAPIQTQPSEPLRRAMPAPLDPVFPMTEWVGTPIIGVPDTDPVWPLEKAIWKECPLLEKYKIKVYGWADPGVGYSTSRNSNVPLSYYITPNRIELDQGVLCIERFPDTVQTDHKDWGFRMSNVYGIDYRFTTAQGWGPASAELLKHNYLYGYDPTVEMFGLIYLPKIAQGAEVRFGRYISPPDIDAQLSPQNFLWTHSLMFTVDAYTHTGIDTIIKLNDQWQLITGITAGNDMAPWARGAHPTGEAYLRWVSKNNKDSIFGGADAFNGWKFTGQHDNLQQYNVTWGHKINRRLNIMTEGYFLYELDALRGGTVSNGPERFFGGGGGPGVYLPGISTAWGLVNYTNLKITDRDYISLRPVDYLFDPRGERTGYPGTFASWTIGWCHRFSDLLCIRPEIRYERVVGGHSSPYDNGLPASPKRYQFTFGFDVIQRF
jgi:hypothetical protein